MQDSRHAHHAHRQPTEPGSENSVSRHGEWAGSNNPQAPDNHIRRVALSVWEIAVRQDVTFGIVLFAAFAVLYLFTLSHSNSFDAIAYAIKMRDSIFSGRPEHILHPHHLAHMVLGLLVHNALSSLAADVNTLLSLQVLSALCGAFGLVVYYVLLRKVTGSPFLAATLTLLLGVTKGYWTVSTDALPYAPAMAGFMLSLLMLHRFSRKPSSYSALWAGIFIGLTVLLHQSHLLLLSGGLVFVFMTGKRIVVNALFLAGGTTVTLLAAYGVALMSMPSIHSLSDAYLFLSRYPRLGWWWNLNVISNLPDDWHALANAFIVMPGTDAMSHAAVEQTGALLPIATSLGAAGALLLVCASIAGSRGSASGHRCSLRWLLIALIYAAFFTVWCPGFYAFWIPIMVLLMLVGAENLARIPGRTPYLRFAVYGTTVALLTANALGSAMPRMDGQSNRFLRMAESIASAGKHGDIVILSGTGYNAPAEVYIQYFADRETVSLNLCLNRNRDVDSAIAEIQDSIDSTLREGNKVFIMGDIFGSKPARQPLVQRYGVQVYRAFDMLHGLLGSHTPVASGKIAYYLETRGPVKPGKLSVGILEMR